jgi:uncharacterized protein (DUF3820 family)
MSMKCQNKGKTYSLLWQGPIRHGNRAHLKFVNGDTDFWVDASQINLQGDGGPEMPFGKYRGTPVSALPDDHVDWLLPRSGVEIRDPKLREALTKRWRLTDEGQEADLDAQDDDPHHDGLYDEAE